MADSWSDLKWPKKPNLYVYVSLLFFVAVLVLLCTDVGCLFLDEDQSRTTQSVSLAVFVVHTVGFYVALLGFVYNTQRTEATTSVKWAFAALSGHGLVFALRVAMELSCLGYRPEFYRMAK